MFVELGLIGNAIILIISLLILDRASSWAITHSVKIADLTGMGKTTVGFILVAFSTSLPELSVAIFAATGEGTVGVAIGNILGSNIANINLILGLCFLVIALRKNSTKTKFLPTMAKEDMSSLYFGLFIASIIPLTLLYIGFASRFIGIVLVAIFVFYIYQLSKIKKAQEETLSSEERRKIRSYIILTFFAAAMVVVSSFFIVESASFIAVAVGIPRVVIGATVVAFGTSLPELATALDSVRKGHVDLALGNIVGSCFINITLILGATLAVSALIVDIEAFSSLVMFSLITNLFLWYFLSSRRISWKEGAVLLFMYSVFLTVTFGGYRP